MLEKALEIGEYFKVKYKLNVKKIINPYPKLFERLEKEITGVTVRKKVKNVISGLTGKTYSKSTSVRLTTSKNDIMKFIRTETKSPFIKQHEDIYFYGRTKETPLYCNRLLTYIQTLDHFNMLNYTRSHGTGGLVIGRHIDAFYVYKPTNTDHLSDKDGDYKHEDFKPIVGHKKNVALNLDIHRIR